MKDQILKILSHYGLSATSFAEEIGVQRSSISHILSGRNKPSYDFIVRILEKYPAINPLWLLTGKGEMISNDKDGTVNTPKELVPEKKTPDLFNEIVVENKNQGGEIKQIKDYISKQTNEVTNVNNVKYVILLYTDGTFFQYKKTNDE